MPKCGSGPPQRSMRLTRWHTPAARQGNDESEPSKTDLFQRQAWKSRIKPAFEAITNSLALTNVQLLHVGDYMAVVTDASGSVTSRVATLQVDLTFTKITTGNIVTDGGASTACAWGDYDNDGFLDLFVGNGALSDLGGDNSLFRNQGDGTFEKISTWRRTSASATPRSLTRCESNGPRASFRNCGACR